jgi:hypothetical protein
MLVPFAKSVFSMLVVTCIMSPKKKKKIEEHEIRAIYEIHFRDARHHFGYVPIYF